MIGEYSVLLSLSGWTLIIHCPKCGIRRKPVDELLTRIHGSAALRSILPRIACSVCASPPSRIEAVCDWVRKYGVVEPPQEDLTWLVQARDAA